MLTKDGALLVDTGKFTGRSVKDKFVVRDATTEDIDQLGQDQPADDARALGEPQGRFPRPRSRARSELFVADLYGGSQPEYRVNVRVINQMAWHNLFIRTLLVRPAADELAGFEPEYTIINLPSFKADPERHGCRSDTVIAVNFTEKMILIGNTEYSGEMKKGVFGLLNYPASGAGRDADALLGQHRRRRQERDLLRPVGHRQDDAVAPTPAARSSATTSMAGRTPRSSISKAAATPR